MKKTLVYFFAVAVAMALAGCEKDPYVSKEVIQRMRDSVLAFSPTNICFIYNNDVYFLDRINNTPQKITNTPAGVKTELRISHNSQKIAYLNAAGNPEIIDRGGNVLATLTSYTGIKQMDWSNDDATLYMLINDQFYYYGPVISHPALNFSGITGSSPHVLYATLSSHNDLAYIVESYDFTLGTTAQLVLKKNDGTNTPVVIDHYVGDGGYMKYVKFSSHDWDLVVGYGDLSLPDNALSSLDLYTNMKSYPDVRVQYSSTSDFKYPVYRSDKHYIVSALNLDNMSSSSPFCVAAYNISNVTVNTKSDYNSATSELIVDWK